MVGDFQRGLVKVAWEFFDLNKSKIKRVVIVNSRYER